MTLHQSARFKWTHRWALVSAGAGTAMALGLSGPASAQLTKVTNTLTTISTWMQGLGVTVITIAVIWAGIKMIFGHQHMKDLGNIFWGSFLIGAASLVASFFISGSSS
jgi:type IV secretion system protein VirB2